MADICKKTLNKIRTGGSPSDLKITDIKLAKLDMPPWGSWLVKLETNQGICGFGEVRDGASPTYLKMLKSRLVGENPCRVDYLFRKIKQFGGQSRQAGGVSAVEIALWDLAGKAYGVPVYQMLGGKFRDSVRLYADTHIETGRATGIIEEPEKVGEKLNNYVKEGYSVLKILSVELIMSREDNYSGPLDQIKRVRKVEQKVKDIAQTGNIAEVAAANAELYDFNNIPHPFNGMHVTEKGLDELDNYIGRLRSTIGYQVPLAIDHFGHFPLPDMIKIAKKLEKYNLLWCEDMLPWYMTEQYRELKSHTTAPIGTGEDIYLAENFEPLLKAGALDVVHPDILTLGGILEMKKLGDLAEKYNAALAIHMCESPVACLAAAHAATASENFLALEHDSFDMPWWEDLIIGDIKPICKNGFITLTDAPGLGIDDLNDDVIREHGPVIEGDVWISTDEWNNEKSLDRIWS